MNNSGRDSSRFKPQMGRGMWGAQFGMGMPVQKARNFRGTFWRFVRYFRPHGLRLFIVFIAAILSTVFSIWSPKIMGKVTTQLFTAVMLKIRHVPGAGVDFPFILKIVETLVALYLLSSLFSFVQQYTMAGVAQKTVYEMRKQVNEKLSRLPLNFFDSHPYGEILSRFVNDFDNIGNTLQQSLTQLITSIITFVGVIAMMLTISPLLTLVVVLTLPLSAVITMLIARNSQTHFAGQQRYLGELNAHVEEMFTGHKIVKAFGHEGQAIAEFNQINERLYTAGWKAQFISGIIMPLMNFIGNLGFLLVSVVGGVLVTRRVIPIGDVQAFIQYARQFSQPIAQLSGIANIIQSTIASAERIFELLDEPEEADEATDATMMENPQGTVGFDRVGFRYQPEIPLITDMTIGVRSGQTVAIVGPTGAGKTTLVNLLMRFYEVNSGKITIDGVDITTMQRAHLRSLFGMVLQDTWLFHGTIRDNIAYGRESATENEIVEAARAAHADHFIRTLPDGYDTVLNEEASNISQGQKQLLTIARAILTNPAILILDEATSSVDTRTEIHIQRAMKALMNGRTNFVIAHRLSTIREADLILVMNHGRIVEQGTHHELILRQGFYSELYHSQFSGTALESDVGSVV